MEDVKAPSLIPGDFFYFVKVMVEKIHLEVTTDNYKEAQLLAEFAEERIEEAKALMEEGKKEEVEKLLKEAITTQVHAGEKLPESGVGTTEKTEGSTATTVTEKTEVKTAIESKLANNIDSLLFVLEKVENEEAQKAIMKNIEKSFDKLNKKFEKLEEVEAKFEEKMKEIEEEVFK